MGDVLCHRPEHVDDEQVGRARGVGRSEAGVSQQVEELFVQRQRVAPVHGSADHQWHCSRVGEHPLPQVQGQSLDPLAPRARLVDDSVVLDLAEDPLHDALEHGGLAREVGVDGVAGVFFLITEVAAITARALRAPAVGSTDYFLGAGADSRIFLATLFEVILVLAIVGTAATLYAVIRKYSEGIALGYALVRLLGGRWSSSPGWPSCSAPTSSWTRWTWRSRCRSSHGRSPPPSAHRQGLHHPDARRRQRAACHYRTRAVPRMTTHKH